VQIIVATIAFGMGQNFGQVERIVGRLVGIRFRHHLHAKAPFRESARGSGGPAFRAVGNPA